MSTHTMIGRKIKAILRKLIEKESVNMVLHRIIV